jgi:hypothetical protein
MYDLHQIEIDQLNPEEYSMFLAYGDTFPNQTTDPARTGSDILWENTLDELYQVPGREVVRISKCVRNRKYLGGSTFSHERGRLIL